MRILAGRMWYLVVFTGKKSAKRSSRLESPREAMRVHFFWA